jgi:dihydroorotase
LKTLIRNAIVVLPDSVERVNVLIDGKRIASIDAPDSANADESIDAKGLHLLPGLIDDQVHFREPGLDPQRGSSPRHAGLCQRGRHFIS